MRDTDTRGQGIEFYVSLPYEHEMESGRDWKRLSPVGRGTGNRRASVGRGSGNWRALVVMKRERERGKSCPLNEGGRKGLSPVGRGTGLDDRWYEGLPGYQGALQRQMATTGVRSGWVYFYPTTLACQRIVHEGRIAGNPK